MALVAIALLTANAAKVLAQATSRTLAERLGYPADAKLLIVHADDLGVAHSVNDASTKAFATGLVNSGSIMVPCPWLTEIAAFARSNPNADLGLHLTLTSEWRNYRWGPVAPRDRVASLIAEDGYFYPSESEASAHALASEAEIEIRAQIERARKLGIQPTHLDSHMGTLYENKDLFEVLLRLGREYKLPIRMSKDFQSRMSFLPALLKAEDVAIDRIITIGADVPAEGWVKFYSEAVSNLQPGVTEFVIHLAHDDAEMKAVTIDHPNWGSAWRERDLQFFTSDAFRKLLQENGIKLITWRDVRKAQYSQ